TRWRSPRSPCSWWRRSWPRWGPSGGPRVSASDPRSRLARDVQGHDTGPCVLSECFAHPASARQESHMRINAIRPIGGAIILTVARQTGRPVDAIVDLRARGASWAQVFSQLGIRYDTLFAGIDRDPGPYYRSSWSYWTAHRDRPQFTDVQVRELARLQLAQR